MLQALTLLAPGVVELHIAGPCGDPSLMECMKQAAGVKYHGVLPWEHVNRLLIDMDVGMLMYQPGPSYDYITGEGVIKPWEYLGLGLPVIFPNFPKLKALFDSLEVGVAVNPQDPAAIASAISRLRDDPELRRRLGSNGRAVVLRERNWDTEAVKLVKIYERLLSGRSAAPAPEG